MFCFFVPHKIKLLIQHLTINVLSQSQKLEGFCVTTTWEAALHMRRKTFTGKVAE
jgi:hypothetical protein